MLSDFQRAKLIEWAEWVDEHDDLAPMPAGIDIVDAWIEAQALYTGVSFPSEEQLQEVVGNYG